MRSSKSSKTEKAVLHKQAVKQAALFCDAIRRALIAWIPFVEGQEGLPTMTRAMLAADLRDLASDFETARGDLLGEGKQG